MKNIEEMLEILIKRTNHVEKGIVLNQDIIAVIIKQLRAHKKILVSLVCKVYGLNEEEAINFLKLKPSGVDDKK